MTEAFTEIRHRVIKPDQVFPCQVFLRRENYLVLRYVNEEASEVAGVVIPAGSITLAHYVRAASSVWWEMYYPDGAHLADLIHLTSPVQIRTIQVEYTDLLLDIWRTAGGLPRILDEDELQEAVAGGYLDAQTAEAVQQEAREIVSDLPGHAPPLWHKLNPEAPAR